jgi:arabinose-5-phosphate isomerase
VIGGLIRDGIGWVEYSEQLVSLLGLLTDGDLIRALQDHNADSWSRLTAADLMTCAPITVNDDVVVMLSSYRLLPLPCTIRH